MTASLSRGETLIPWDDQPQELVYADPAHWSTKNLRAWLPGNGFYYNAARLAAQRIQPVGAPQFTISTKTDANSAYGWRWARTIAFDGSDDELTIAGFPFLPELTVSAWIFNNPSSDVYRTIISRGDVFENDSNFAFGVRDEAGGRNRLFIYGRNGSSLVGIEDSTNTLLAYDDTWQHIVGTATSAGTWTLYLNGSGTIGGTSGIGADGGQALRFGAGSPGGSAARWKEPAFDMRVYNRAFSAAEVRRLYLEGPWALFEPQRLLLPVAAAAPASTGSHRVPGGGWGGRVISERLRNAA